MSLLSAEYIDLLVAHKKLADLKAMVKLQETYVKEKEIMIKPLLVARPRKMMTCEFTPAETCLYGEIANIKIKECKRKSGLTLPTIKEAVLAHLTEKFTDQSQETVIAFAESLSGHVWNSRRDIITEKVEICKLTKKRRRAEPSDEEEEEAENE